VGRIFFSLPGKPGEKTLAAKQTAVSHFHTCTRIRLHGWKLGCAFLSTGKMRFALLGMESPPCSNCAAGEFRKLVGWTTYRFKQNFSRNLILQSFATIAQFSKAIFFPLRALLI
jgi:hypothetical protein